VNFTTWPDTDGFTDEVNVVLVEAFLTVCERAGEVPGKKCVSPEYTAVIE
jgi:hypothetical protein